MNKQWFDVYNAVMFLYLIIELRVLINYTKIMKLPVASCDVPLGWLLLTKRSKLRGICPREI
jgi:uncharacterized membrane protein (DUF485 family)